MKIDRSDIKQAELQDDPEVEIIDLPLAGESRVPAALTRAMGAYFSPRGRKWRFATLGGAVFLALLVILGGMPSLWNGAAGLIASLTVASPPPSQAESADTSLPQSVESGSSIQIVGTTPPNGQSESWVSAGKKIIIFNHPLEPAPQQCPLQSRLTAFDARAFPPGAGGPPLWVTGFSGSRARLVNSNTSQFLAEYGWTFAISLVVQSSYAGRLFLSGKRQDNQRILWFDNLIPGGGQTNALILDIHGPTALMHPGDQGWKVWRVTTYVPTAGCYSLTAQWPGGHWQIDFAAGR